MTGTSVSAGKICARIDYGLLCPVATDVAEVLQTNIGAVASCNISQAGDYIVLQLSYRLKSLAEEQYHNLPRASSFWAPLLSPRVIPEPASVYWTRTLQLIATSIGVAFLLVFVCCARMWSASNRARGMISFEEYEVDDDDHDKSSWEGYLYPGFDSHTSQRSIAFGSPRKMPPRSDSNTVKTSGTSMLRNADTPASENVELFSALSHQESDSSDDRARVPLRYGRLSVSGLMKAPANKLLQMATMGPLVKQNSSSSFASSAATDTTGVVPFGSTFSEVKALLEMQSMSGRDSDGRTALHLAAAMSDISAVRALLDAEDGLADPRHTDYRGKTPVHVAASHGYDDTVAELVMFAFMLSRQRPPSAENSNGRRRAFSINQQDQAGNSPLHLAAAKGHVDVVRALERTSESCALDLGSENNKGFTPLQLAAYNGHTEMVMKLLKLNPKAAFPRYQGSPTKSGELSSDRATSGMTPLHIASTRGHVKLVRSLLEWMKQNEELCDYSSDEEDEYSFLAPPAGWRGATHRSSTGFQGFSRSLSALKGIASTSAKKLQRMVSWKKREILDKDFLIEMSTNFDFDAREEDLFAVDDTEPLILQQTSAGGSGVGPEAHRESAAARNGEALQQPVPQPDASHPKPTDLGDTDNQTFRVVEAASHDTHPVGDLLTVDDLDTEVLPPSMATAPDEGHGQDDVPVLEQLIPGADDVHNNVIAVGKESSVASSALKDAALQKNGKKAGIPAPPKTRPRVAGQVPGRLSGSGPASSGLKPGAGQRAGAKLASQGTAQEQATARKGQAPKASSTRSPRTSTGGAAAAPRQSKPSRLQVPGKAAVATGRHTMPAARSTLASGGTRSKDAKASAPVAIVDMESITEEDQVDATSRGPANDSAADGDLIPTPEETASSSPPPAATDFADSASGPVTPTMPDASAPSSPLAETDPAGSSSSRPVTPSAAGASASSRPSTPKLAPEVLAKRRRKTSQIVSAYGPMPGPLPGGRRVSTDASAMTRPSTVGNGVGRMKRHSVGPNAKPAPARRNSALDTMAGQVLESDDAEDISVRPVTMSGTREPMEGHLPDGVEDEPLPPRIHGWN